MLWFVSWLLPLYDCFHVLFVIGTCAFPNILLQVRIFFLLPLLSQIKKYSPMLLEKATEWIPKLSMVYTLSSKKDVFKTKP
jgi:hypothetical protein